MELTITLPDQLGRRISEIRDQIPELLELGLRKRKDQDAEAYADLADVLDKLAELPAPAEVMELRPSKELQIRISDLLAKNRGEGLTASEESEWAQYERFELVVRMAKARAAVKLAEA